MFTDLGALEPFIVDNSNRNWTCLRYLETHVAQAHSLDVATGVFDVGALVALQASWNSLGKIRILMGAETTSRTRKVILEAVLKRAVDVLDAGLEADKETSPFLSRVGAVVEAMRTGRIECRVYDKDKFHAKAYIANAHPGADTSQALVGSSNLTVPGLTKNVELNVRIHAPPEVAQLQAWFEAHWKDATDVTDTLVEAITRHIRLYQPFDVYARALHEFFRGHELTDNEWEESRSQVFPRLDRYQKEAYWRLLDIAQHQDGAFLCDGVGLGKTFVGLMLIERLVLHEGKRVVLFAPKAAKDGVWEPHLKEWLSHIGGGADFSNLAVFSHTDLGRGGEYPERFRRIAELADAVIVDEAHHFRNPGRPGQDGDPSTRSRYYQLYDLLDPAYRRKSLFLLTATPINNRLADFRHMAELFTRRDEAHFGRTLGIHNFRAHFNRLEKQLQQRLGSDTADVGENLSEAQDVLATDQTFRELVVQRSRSYARASQQLENKTTASFPDRQPPKVAEYSIRRTYGRLLEQFEQAFSRQNPLFSLAMYYPLHWYRGPNANIAPFDENRQKQVVGLIRTQFLKRFESSVRAFELSCDRLLRKLLAFVEVHSESDSEKRRLERWKLEHAEVLGYVKQHELQLDNDEADEDADEDIVPPELLAAVERLDRKEYDVVEMLQETFADLNTLVAFLDEARRFEPKHDDKLQKLIRLLKSKELDGQKVLIFTEFADTARYLMRELTASGIDGLAQVDSATKLNRAVVIRRFAPYYNGSSSAELAERGESETRVLISTDVLSEGLNLQDASRMINYDIHWNPVRLMQRIGRVDRRMNPAVEAGLVADHPHLAASRGKVSFWNFLPPDELNAILTLYTRVTQKTLLISRTLGIEGRKLLTPEDDYEALKEFNQSYEGTRTAIEDMHLEYQRLVAEDPDLPARLDALPGAIFSGRKRARKGLRGVFFCYALPALDKETNSFTPAAGKTGWYFYDLDQDAVLEEPGDIVASIRSDPVTPRLCTMTEEALVEIKAKIEKHIKNGYMKRLDAPLGVKPSLKCWMELNEG